MKSYNIYAGLSGGYGGADYQYTAKFSSADEAETMARMEAMDIYCSYEGSNGLLSWEDVRNEYDSEGYTITDADVDAYYLEEIESWMEYYAIPEDEDTNEVEIDRR